MRIKRSYLVIGGIVTGVVLTVGVSVAVVRAVRKHTKRILKRKTRRAMADILQMRGEDFVPGGELGKSLYRSHIEKLDDRQLTALFALVEVGYFIKASGINPLHPSKEQIKAAAEKYLFEERRAPATRDGLLNELDTSDAYDALNSAYKVFVTE